jgi:protein subunit release factor B
VRETELFMAEAAQYTLTFPYRSAGALPIGSCDPLEYLGLASPLSGSTPESGDFFGGSMPRIIINPGDITYTAFRGSGPGGQHKNKTSSCIRAIHGPTGLRAEGKSERCQYQNKAAALALLLSKIERHYQGQVSNASRLAHEAKPESAFGSQRRTYRLCGNPQGVVDHETGYCHPNTAAVLRGDLDGFLVAGLKRKP